MDTTLGSQHVEATRVWIVKLDDLMLHSLTGEVWLPGEIKESSCQHINRMHKDLKVQPEFNCTCGIWSCRSRKELHRLFHQHISMLAQPSGFYYGRPDILVSGRIEQWGIVIEHETGYRSEFARLIPQTLQILPRGSHKHKKLLAHLKGKYSQ